MAFDVKQGEVVGGRGVSELGGGGEQLGALFAIDGASAAAEMQHREREHGLAIAALGSQPIPFGRLFVIALNAQAVGIELAEQRHRLDVFLLVRSTGRGRKGGDVVAALEGAVSKVGLAPGSAFGPMGEGYIRLCFARDPQQVAEAIERLRPLLD